MCKWLYIAILSIILFHTSILAQKPAIDSSVFGKWEEPGSPFITNNGQYVLYYIGGRPVGGSTLVIQDITDSWSVELPGWIPVINSDYVVISKEDSLGVFNLKSKKISFITNVNLIRNLDPNFCEWIGYTLRNKPNTLVLHHLVSGKKITVDSVIDYHFTPDREDVVIVRRTMRHANTLEALKLSKSGSPNFYKFWEGRDLDVNSLTFSEVHRCFAFLTESAGAKGKSLWFLYMGRFGCC